MKTTMMRFQCPHCRGIVAVETSAAGSKVECAHCAATISAPVSRLAPGVLLGDFLIIRPLGAGGMGKVFFSHQLSLDRPAAIKVLNPEYSSETESVMAFIREARAAAKLNHPNIVQAYAVGEESGIFYFAMEYIDGKTMKQVLQEEGKIEPRRAADVIRQAANALACAWNEQKLVHHDIKPDNLMLCANNQIKLADLGLSQVFGEDANDDSDEVIGTPQYISPEQLTGVVTDTRSDIYSLGATFYHFVTGRFPYLGDTAEEITKQHIFGTLIPPYEIDSAIPVELSRIIVKMMGRTPAERYQCCEDLVTDLEHFLNPPANNNASTSSKLLNSLNSGAMKIIQPPNRHKISLTHTNSQTLSTPQTPETPTVASEAPATASAKPEIHIATEAAAPKITLLRPDSKKATPAPAPESAPQAEAVPAPEEAPSAAAATVPVAEETTPTSEPVPPGATVAETPAAPQNDVPASPAAAESASESEKKEAEAIPAPISRKKSPLVWILPAFLVILAVGCAIYFWPSSPNAPTPGSEHAPTPVLAQNQPEALPPTPTPEANTPEEPESAPAPEAQPVALAMPPVAPQAPEENLTIQNKQPVVSEILIKVNTLHQLKNDDPDQFLKEANVFFDTVKAESIEEFDAMSDLYGEFITVEEQAVIRPNRDRLIEAYYQEVEHKRWKAAKEKLVNEEIQRDKEMRVRGMLSVKAYEDDIARRRARLNYYFTDASLSGEYDKFRAELADARNEVNLPQIKSRPNFQPIAQQFVKYADMLENVFYQGLYINQVMTEGEPRLNGILFGYADAATAEVTRIKDGVIYAQDSSTHKELKFIPAEMDQQYAVWLFNFFGKRLIRQDLYFYYMLFNGEFGIDFSFAAPKVDWMDWESNARAFGYNFFCGELERAMPDEIEELTHTYGHWQSFQYALEWLRQNRPDALK